MFAEHPTRDQLRALSRGSLLADEADAVEAHIVSCAACWRSLAELAGENDSFLSALRGAGTSLMPGSRSAPRAAERAEVSWPTIAGYEVRREVGRGGMGVVYEAHQHSLNRTVALKVILAADFASAEKRLRFRLEAEMAARVKHPNVVQVHEVGLAEGQQFLAMEWVEGGTLEATLQRGPLGVNEAAALCETLARAVHAAHCQGVVHRDLKPANILLAAGGVALGEDATPPAATPKISDFGLARLVEEDGITQTGDRVGTPAYMAPEQAIGATRLIGPAVDIYALGVCLYEMLLGRPPFKGVTPIDTLNQVVAQEPTPPRRLRSAVPRDLDTICLKCLAKEPARRYPTAEALADELHRFLIGEPIQARPVGTLERAWMWTRRRPTIAALMLTVVVSLLGGSIASTFFAVRSLRSRDEARAAEQRAVEARNAAQQQSAGLLFDQALDAERQGRSAEALHRMLAALDASPDPHFQRLIRIYLATLTRRLPVLRHWLDVAHLSTTAFSQDGSRLALSRRVLSGPGDWKAEFAFCAVETGELGPWLPNGDRGMDPLQFHPDGKTLLSASSRVQQYHYKPGWVSLWSVPDGQPLGKSFGHDSTVDWLGWTPDGKRYLSRDWKGKVCVRDRVSGSLVTDFATAGLAHVAVAPDGVSAVSLTPNGAVLLDLVKGTTTAIDLVVERDAVQAAAFSPDGSALLFGLSQGPRGTVIVQPWNNATQRPRGSLRRLEYLTPTPTFLADGRIVPHHHSQVSPDGRRFLRTVEGVQLWQTALDQSTLADDLGALTGTTRHTFTVATFSPNRQQVWTSSDGRFSQAWELRGGRPVGVPIPDQPIWGRGVSLSLDGRRIATIAPPVPGVPNAARLHEALTARPLSPLLPSGNFIRAVALTPDARFLAAGGHRHVVDFWDLRGEKPVHQSLNMDQVTMHLSFQPSGGCLAVAGFEGQVRLWDVDRASGAATVRLSLAHPETVVQVHFNPDGTRLLALCGSAAHLWDVSTGTRIGAPLAAAQLLSGAAPEGHLRARFSADGRLVLTSHGFSSYRLWDARTGQPLGAAIAPQRNQSSEFDISPDGRLVVSGHKDGTAQLWDVATSRPLGVAVRHPLPVIGVAFDAEGRTFRTVTTDGAIRTWPVPTPLEGQVRHLTRAALLMTGVRLDQGGNVVPLTRQEWEDLRRDWRQRAGNDDWNLGVGQNDEDWHDARARDAEATGNTFTARWHLDRLLQHRPQDPQLYLRRGRTFTDEQRWPRAEADYQQARRHGSEAMVHDWLQYRAAICNQRKDEVGRWYEERLKQRRESR